MKKLNKSDEYWRIMLWVIIVSVFIAPAHALWRIGSYRPVAELYRYCIFWGTVEIVDITAPDQDENVHATAVVHEDLKKATTNSEMRVLIPQSIYRSLRGLYTNEPMRCHVVIVSNETTKALMIWSVIEDSEWSRVREEVLNSDRQSHSATPEIDAILMTLDSIESALKELKRQHAEGLIDESTYKQRRDDLDRQLRDVVDSQRGVRFHMQ